MFKIILCISSFVVRALLQQKRSTVLFLRIVVRKAESNQ